MSKKYFDNAATTKMNFQVHEAIQPYMRLLYENPSAMYTSASAVKEAVDKARRQAADLINAESEEIYFTSGGSESDNWAIKGIMMNPGYWHLSCREGSEKAPRLITSVIEHHAVLNAADYIDRFEDTVVQYLPVDKFGYVNPEDDLDYFLSFNDAYSVNLVSVMMANNEIGTIQDVKRIAELCHTSRKKEGMNESTAIFHTDAVQAFGHIPIDVKELDVDLLSASGHKIGAPKGVGILYIANRVKDKVVPLIHGGSQENGLRGGTYNVPGIVGMGTACEIAKEKLADGEVERVAEMRDYMMARLLMEIPYTAVNGGRSMRLPGNINIRFDGVDAQNLLTLLVQDGYCCSVGSACDSGSNVPSHVLKAIGLTDEQAGESVRITIDGETDREDCDGLIDEIKRKVELLRSLR